MRYSHNQSRARVRVQHQRYPSAIFGTQASLKNATGHVRCFLRTVAHMLFLYLILLLAVWISSQLITAPSGAEVQVSDPDWPNPHLFNGSMDDVWDHVEQDEECFHCLFENWMKDDPGMSDLLSCLLSDEVTTIPVHVRSTHLLSMKRCTAFNAMFRRLTILVITFVRQVAVSLLITFLGLSTILCEEMLAHPAARKKGKKDAFSPCRKESAFEFIFVPSSFTIGVAAVKRYKRLAVYKELHNLLLKFPSLKLRRRTKFARRIHGQLVVSFTIRRSCVMRLRFRPPGFCLALLRCIAHLVKEVLAQAVSVMPSVLLCGLLLQAGDVEVNPGPIHDGGTFPLSSWNNDALLFLREKLKHKVLMNIGLSAKLERAAGGFMSQYEARKVRELHSNSAQVDKVIETLCGKGDEDFKTFCKLLHDNNQVIWADELKRMAEQFKRVEEGTGGGEREQVDSFSSCLVEYYMNMKVVTDEWLPADQSLPFVNLALVRFHLSAQHAQEMFVEAVREGVDNVYTYQTGKVEFKEIPGLVKMHKLVIISGAPGVGKSTLARRICQDVCQPLGCHGYILVILVELRDLLHFKKDFQLIDILQLFRGMMTHDVSLEKLSEAICSNLGRGVLFILDGFDELPPHLRQSNFLVNLLSHNRASLLRHCDVILTSRSIVTSEIYHQMQMSYSQFSLTNIEVLGFTQNQIMNCAKQYFADCRRPDLFDLFVRKIGAFPHIRGLCSIPVVLSIICQVFLFREGLPPTLTQIYNDYLCVKVLKYNEDLSELNSIMDLPKDHDIYKLGEIAYNCIQKQKVVFDSSDLQGLGERFSDRKRGCGVLTARPIRCDPKSGKVAIESFFFIHLTVQKFLAAVYVSLLTADSQCEIWARYLGEPHMAQVWRFYCGLTKLQHFDRLQKKINSYNTDFQMQCLYETQDISLVHCLMPRIVGEKVKVRPQTAYDSTAYGYCLSVLPSLKSLTFEKCARSAEIHRLLEPVYASGTLQTLDLANSGTDWRVLEVALDRLVSLERVASTDDAFKGHFGKVHLERPPLSTVVKLLCLQHVTEVVCVAIQGCEPMDHEVLMKMERSLSGNKTMNKLTLSGVGGVTLPKQLCHQLLLGIGRNYSLSEVSLSLNPQNWCCPDDVPAGDQGSVQHLTLKGAPVDAFINLLSFFSKVKELKCHSIHPPQENMRDEELDMKLRDMMQGLAGMRQLKKLIIGMDVNFPNHLMVGVGQYLLQSISRSKLSLSVFALYGDSSRESLLLDILMRVSPDERKMFASGKYGRSYPCIRLSHGTDEDFSDDDSIGAAEDDNNKVLAELRQADLIASDECKWLSDISDVVRVQSTKSPDIMTNTATVMRRHGLEEESKLLSVLAELRQADLIASDECKELSDISDVVRVQHTKSLDVMTKTAAVFRRLGYEKESKFLSGQELLQFEERYSSVVSESASVTLKITKCTTIGPPRSGKTCLKHLLTGKKWDVDGGTASTDVMEAPEWVECFSVEEGGAKEIWKVVTPEEQQGELLRAINTLKSTANDAPQPSQDPTSTTPPCVGSPTTKPREDPSTPPSGAFTSNMHKSGEVPPPTTVSKAPLATTDAVHRATPKSTPPATTTPSASKGPATVMGALNALACACSPKKLQDFLIKEKGKVLGETRLIHFIDTGGQAIYHDVHPVLITSPSVYLVVFSLKELYERKSKDEQLDFFRSDLIQRPLRSIYTFGTKKPQERDSDLKMVHLKFHSEATKIFIVGTHRDKIPQGVSQEEFLKSLDKMIEGEIGNKPYCQFVQCDPEGRSFWAVDNTLAGKEQDEDVSSFRKMVQEDSTSMSMEVPLPWMLLKMVMDGKRKCCCRYSELLEEARIRNYVREEAPNADLDTMLWLFHILGLMYHKVPTGYTRQDSLVFINPNCLFSTTSDFLMAAKEEIEESSKEQHQIQAAEEEYRQGGTKEEQHQAQGIVQKKSVIDRIQRNSKSIQLEMEEVQEVVKSSISRIDKDPIEAVLQSLHDDLMAHYRRIGQQYKLSPRESQYASSVKAKRQLFISTMVHSLITAVRAMPHDDSGRKEEAHVKEVLGKAVKSVWAQCLSRSIEHCDMDQVLSLLSGLRIVAKLGDSDSYVVPAALPKVPPHSMGTPGSAASILVTVVSQTIMEVCYLPSGLFCCMISELVTKLGWAVHPQEYTHVAFTHESFAGKVHITEYESYIKVEMELEASHQELSKTCQTVREMIHESIVQVHKELFSDSTAGTTFEESLVWGFQCEDHPADRTHIAAFQDDGFEYCANCLVKPFRVQDVTSGQLVWFTSELDNV